MPHLLVVEDDRRVSDFLSRGLRAEGYQITVIERGDLVQKSVEQLEPDLILLDVMLPGINGVEACQRLRAARVRTPVLMLTAMDALEDKVAGLRCGADDYLTKPFAFDELLARIEALLRRVDAHMEEAGKSRLRQISVADVVLDLERMQVRRDNGLVPMTARELALLELLMRHPGRVFSRERILNTIWGYSEDPLTNVVDVYIRRLRAKLDEGREQPLILTVRGLGYKIDSGPG
ncbi:response regulator transcription factor [Kinneretia asaccharophila]|uniref:DNA-binding response OmpR family regulator n=1 Tax=Roseateles asaccharophilus TaxID=582607 RepID=A0A4R6MZN2_9BURK|nr:response regulator transcription factor [Roseateles asaccharophilus]MDN3545480.1 response regulator transcription factor [Roseateles asaccharophilus]TDP07860.1 DNA-binding response OmpR family regulator [Roseateles asaccharophilus]